MDRGDKTYLNFRGWNRESVNLMGKYYYTEVYEI